MRSTLIPLMLVCVSAFCQDAIPAPGGSDQKSAADQKLNEVLKPNAETAFNIFSTDKLTLVPAAKPCSIPLLNAKAAGTPVPMPTARTEPMPPPSIAAPQTGAGKPAPSPPVPPRPVDRMTVVPPAPACPADFGRAVEPPRAPATKP